MGQIAFHIGVEEIEWGFLYSDTARNGAGARLDNLHRGIAKWYFDLSIEAKGSLYGGVTMKDSRHIIQLTK
jgi:hypothetical protein